MDYCSKAWITTTVAITVGSRKTQQAAFDLMFYGLTALELAHPPIGSDIIRTALQRKGLDPDDFVVSSFWIYVPDRSFVNKAWINVPIRGTIS